MNSIIDYLFSDRGKDIGLLILRLGFGLGMVYHGWGKVAGGAEGVIGFAGSVGLPFPTFFGWAAALSEFLGGIGLLLGLLTRVSSCFIIFTMYTAVFVRHIADPFGAKELALAYLFAGLCLLVAGAGKYSLDRLLFGRSERSISDARWKQLMTGLTAVVVVMGSIGVYFTALEASTTEESSIVTETVAYEHDGVALEGYLAYDESASGNRPGVMVVHQWMGLGDYEKKRARQLAELGYVAFAADIYGSDTRPETTHMASLASSTFREDRNLYRRRINRSLGVLKQQTGVDSNNIAAIGYCFGGTGVLELARSGADVDAVVSFHGGLTNPSPADAENIRATVQVHHGAEDSHVTKEHVVSFWDEMNEYASVDWDVRVYSGAEHGFTESHSDAYNERADRLSWKAMKQMFEREFSSHD